MQIFCPSAFQAMLLTTDLFLLLIISSYQDPDNTARNYKYMYIVYMIIFAPCYFNPFPTSKIS